MKTSFLICATTCLVVAGCSAQTFKFPSLSSALSSWTGFGGGSGSSSAGSGSGAAGSGSASQASPSSYNGIVREYGRNLMMAMSNIYPTLFKPPQSVVQAAQSAPQQVAQSPFEQAFGAASQYGSQALFPSQSAPQFTLGGSTFSISPQLPFSGAFGTGSSAPSQQLGSHSPFSASFGSSINSPSSFGPLSSGSFLQQSLSQSFGGLPQASSYGSAFDAAAAQASQQQQQQPGGPNSFASLSSLMNPQSASASQQQQQQQQAAGLLSQPSNTNSINSYAPALQGYGSQQDSLMLAQGSQHQPMGPAGQQVVGGGGGQHNLVNGPQQQQQQQAYASQQNQYAYRPDMMSIAASAPVPSSNSYMNYGLQSGAGQQMSSSSYQQGAYR